MRSAVAVCYGDLSGGVAVRRGAGPLCDGRDRPLCGVIFGQHGQEAKAAADRRFKAALTF
jgi:hypothetical protein